MLLARGHDCDCLLALAWLPASAKCMVAAGDFDHQTFKKPGHVGDWP